MEIKRSKADGDTMTVTDRLPGVASSADVGRRQGTPRSSHLDQTSETIDRNRAIGRTHSSTSARVSDQRDAMSPDAAGVE